MSDYLKIRIEARDLENVKEAVRIINNKVYRVGFQEYDYQLLDALLGDNWSEDYVIGKYHIEKKK